MDCHVPTLSEQIGEGAAWLTGNYGFPLVERTASELTEASGRQADELCLNESCHNLTRDDLYELTADMGAYNSHWAHHEELECTTCHKAIAPRSCTAPSATPRPKCPRAGCPWPSPTTSPA